MRIFLLRHAAYSGNDENPVLSDMGKRQAAGLASKIARVIGSSDAVIWTSAAARAQETANIIAERLGIENLEVHEKLWSDNKHSYDFNWLRAKIAEHQGPEVVIIISHLEYVQRFFNSNQAGYAEGVMVENDEVTMFR